MPPAMRLRRLLLPLLLFAFAYAVRLAFLVQLAASPFFNFLHLDPLYYHEWARRIVAGDWIGHEVFEMSPLYSYLLALFMLVAGDDLWRLRLLQIGVGALTCVLTYLLGRRLFGRSAGLVAGLGCAVYGPFLFYEGQVMKEFLTPPLATAAILLALPREKESRRAAAARLAASGALLALAALVRDNFLVLLAALGAWALLSHPLRARGTAALAAGALAVLLPVGARNALVGGDFVLTTSGGGEVFYIGNGPYANGAYVPPPWVRSTPRFEHEDFRQKARELTGREMTRGEASHFWWRQGIGWLAQHPVRGALLWGRKLALFWNDHELPDNYSFYTFRQFSSVLARTLTFGPVAALAWCGVVMTWGDRRRLAPLYLAAGAYMMSVLIFFNFARFRLPMVPLLLVFAGAGAAGLWRAADAARRSRRLDARAGWAAALAAVVLATSFVDWSTPYEEPFQDRLHLGAAYKQAGRLEEAEATLRRVITDAEAVVRRHGGDPSRAATTPGGITFALALSAAHRDLAGVLLDRGRPEEAVRSLETAVALSPTDTGAWMSLGAARRRTGDAEGAEQAYRRAAEISPKRFDVWFDLATAQHERGRSSEALVSLQHAREGVELTALETADWHYGMGTVLYEMGGRDQEAAAHFREALALNPDASQAAEVREALKAIEAGRPATAP
jgi:tetratricopeptide (TPR) repeat protein